MGVVELDLAQLDAGFGEVVRDEDVGGRCGHRLLLGGRGLVCEFCRGGFGCFPESWWSPGF